MPQSLSKVYIHIIFSTKDRKATISKEAKPQLQAYLIELAANSLGADTEEMAFIQSIQRYLIWEFQQGDASQMQRGMVHLDIWFENLNITDDQKATIFDFAFCGNGWLCLDISYYILRLHNIEKYEAKDYQPKIESFIKGYESVLPISAEKQWLIPILGVRLYFFYLGIQCQRFAN